MGATMDDRIMQFRVGVVVLAVALIAAVMTLRFSHFEAKSYTIYIDFASAAGIAPGTPIKSSGVLIGRVSSVTLQTDKPDQPVHVTAEIESKYQFCTTRHCNSRRDCWRRGARCRDDSAKAAKADAGHSHRTAGSAKNLGPAVVADRSGAFSGRPATGSRSPPVLPPPLSPRRRFSRAKRSKALLGRIRCRKSASLKPTWPRSANR